MTIMLSPGVLTFEHPSGASVVRGAVSNRLLAIGMARKGPLGQPVQVLSYEQYLETFGDDLTYGELGLQMRQFFTAGGSDAIVVRAANTDARPASVMLSDEFGDDALEVTALSAGVLGDQIRIDIDYDTADPELTFNATFFRETIDALGRLGRSEEETFSNLSMDPASGNFVENVINGNSALVKVRNAAAVRDLSIDNSNVVYTQSSTLFDSEASFDTFLGTLGGASIVLEINGRATAPIDLGTPTNVEQVGNAINTALTAQGLSTRVTASLVSGSPISNALRIAVSSTDGTRSIRALPALTNDATAELALGATRGGVEVGLYSSVRPAMSGMTTRPFAAAGNITAFLNTIAAANAAPYDADFADGATTSVQWGIAGATAFANDGTGTDLSLVQFRANLDTLVAALNASALDGIWTFERIGLRLRGVRDDGSLAASTGATLTQDAASLTPTARRASFALGQNGGTTTGQDGNAPVLSDYQAIFSTVSRRVTIWNMLITPRCPGQTDADRRAIRGPASSFCRDENALYITDPQSENGAWTDVFEVTDATGLTDYKSGIIPEVTCAFWPRVRVPLGTAQVHIDPCGTIAGVIASSIARSGPWNTAAGLSAPLVGVTGLEYAMSDADNGVINPRGINALRAKSTGHVVWGGRMLAGDDNFSNRDFAYISVRMTTDFIKNSVSRALEGYVFKNNNRDTWANIEMMVRAFMHSLYTKGAFRGATAEQAYDVRCNELTTTPTDILLGIMNVWVLFAPQFPAEFIHLHIQHKFDQPSV